MNKNRVKILIISIISVIMFLSCSDNEHQITDTDKKDMSQQSSEVSEEKNKKEQENKKNESKVSKYEFHNDNNVEDGYKIDTVAVDSTKLNEDDRNIIQQQIMKNTNIELITGRVIDVKYDMQTKEVIGYEIESVEYGNEKIVVKSNNGKREYDINDTVITMTNGDYQSHEIYKDLSDQNIYINGKKVINAYPAQFIDMSFGETGMSYEPVLFISGFNKEIKIVDKVNSKILYMPIDIGSIQNIIELENNEYMFYL